jgi:predicted dehydrogenase
MVTERKLGVGVIGCGGIANGAHLINYARNPRVKLVAVADIDVEKAKLAAVKWDVPNYFADFQDVINHPDVEMISVTTWPTAHAAPVIAAAAVGKHILCEKPIATTLEEADAMVAAADAAGVKFAMGYQPQFGRIWPAVKQLIDEGICGRLMGMSVTGLAPSSHRVPWFLKRDLSGGGILMDWGIYTAYYAQWLLGPVESVSAQKEIFRTEVNVGETRLTDVDVEDTVAATLRFRNGMLGAWYLGWAVAAPHSSMSIDGSAGSILTRTGVDGIGVYTTTVPQPDYLNGWRHVPVTEMALVDQHYGKLAHLVDAVLDDTPLVQTGAAGRDALELVLAIYRAAELGQTVTLPLPRA